MMTFDRVLPELIRLLHEEVGLNDAVTRFCIVRDVRGRVRLIVEPRAASPVPLGSLEANLEAIIGKYFVGPILSAAHGGDVQRLAKQLLDQADGKWPGGWPRSFRNVLGGADTSIETGTRWTGIERTIGKEAWLASSSVAPPWPLVKDKTPPIVTFHSFKGGVGRTTLVAAYAIRLATKKMSPKRVAIVDLDLEAPGVGSLLGVNPERGVLDVLIDHIATGEIDLDGASSSATLQDGAGQKITVFSAGRPDDSYVQKLARLDFSSVEPGKDNPVGLALEAMLRRMKPDYDVILLDSRAGLHDLAGMSLHGLAHVDVLVFRGTEQNLLGLGQTLRALGTREVTKLVLVETLLPASDEELFDTRRQRSRSRVYEMLCEHIYPDDDPPQLGDVGVPHDIVAVRRKEWLDGLDTLENHVTAVLNEGDLKDVARRINEECALGAEDTEDADGDANDDEEDE